VTDLRQRALDLDATDELASFRDRVVITDPDVRYLDGNSLGRLPVATRDRLRAFVDEEWGGDLVEGWGRWVDLPVAVGDALGAALLGVGPGETVVCDSVTVNLHKLALAGVRRDPARTVVVTDDDNFPTDRFVLEEVARLAGSEVRVVHTDIDEGVSVDAVRAALGPDVALVSLSHTAYRSGALAPVAEIDRLAHEAGALTLWDLSHTVGSVPVDLSTADMAVGCTYKYVNGGPGAPAFLWVRPGLAEELSNPVPGWFGSASQFAMDAAYRPAPGVRRFLTGTPPVSGLVAVEEGVRLLADAGLSRLRAKSVALTSYLVDLADAWLADHGVRVASPRDPARRGGHVVLEHPEAWQLAQELRARKVLPDFREPDRIRLGPAPLYTRFVDVHDAMAELRDTLVTGSHLRHPAARATVT
jgi:kynureninase